jgi:pimeloyl-ACP methyl ester carboxylesterase
VNCGFVVAAAKHAAPGGATVRLPVAVFKAISAIPAAEPVIYLEGGPGGSSQGIVRAFSTDSPLYKGLAANNDVIAFDQRGTGKAQPSLVCGELANMTLRGLYIEAFADSPFVTAANACRDRLVAAGIDLGAYTTTENAADVNDIRLALGYSALNLFGGSYGSELGLAVARDFGPFVRSSTLASLVPIQTAWFFEPAQNFDRAIRELFRACAADVACNAANPALQAAYQSTVARLNATPYPLTLKTRRAARRSRCRSTATPTPASSSNSSTSRS